MFQDSQNSVTSCLVSVTAEEAESEKRFRLRQLIYHRDYHIRPRTDKKETFEPKISVINWSIKNYPVQNFFFPAQLSWANISQK